MTPRRLISILVSLLMVSTTVAVPPEGKPVLVPVWKKATIDPQKSEGHKVFNHRDTSELLLGQYQAAIAESQRLNRPIVPPASPIVQFGLLTYSTDEGIVTRALTGGAWFGREYRPGDLFWESEREFGLHQLFSKFAGTEKFDGWLDSNRDLPNRVFHRTLCHAVSNWKNVIAIVDDAGFSPTPQIEDVFPALDRWRLMTNRTLIREFNSLGGKLVRVIGSNREALEPDFFILGLPLGIDDRRIMLRERDGRVELQRLERPKYVPPSRRVGSDDEVQHGGWEVEVAKSTDSLRDTPQRRIHAIYLIETHGLIITPTNLGRVVAVEGKTGKIKWTHEYAALDAKRFPTFAPEWVVVPPVVVGDKYIYAPADFPELLCLNVADGKKVWSVKKGDGLYPAVVGEQVLVIGEKTLRSLSLKDGSEQWKIDLPGLPCGRGAVLGDTYLLPISEPKTWRGMIAIVDLKTQKIREVLKPDKDEPIGNLVVHQDMLISQTLTEIAVFPIRK